MAYFRFDTVRRLTAKVIQHRGSILRPTNVHVPLYHHHHHPRPSSIICFNMQSRSFFCRHFFETVPYTERKRFMLFSKRMEASIGDALYERTIRKMSSGDTILPDTHPDSVRVGSIYEVIMKAALQRADLEGLNCEMVVVDSPYLVNAFCLLGGKIGIFSGLLKEFKTDAEIAVVIGHEIGHLVARHLAETSTKNLLFAIARLLVSSKTSDLFLKLPLSRKLEKEADYIGMLLMASAGYDPRVAPKVYTKLGEISKESTVPQGEDFLEYFSTHPPGKKRATLLAEPKVMNEALSMYREVCAGKK